MRSLFRSSLVGLLTIAGLAACGDKVTPVPPDNAVHGVNVTPPTATVAVGGSIQLGATVDAGSGVSDRTVSWSSSDAATASVDATGRVTGVKAGNVTIIATSNADQNATGAASVTVTAPAAVAVTIGSVLQGGTNVQANLGNAHDQLDVVLNVTDDANQLTQVTATLTCTNGGSLSASQSLADVTPIAAEVSASQVTLSLPTTQFDAATGAPAVKNGACAITASGTVAGGTQTATNSESLTLNNADVMIVKTANNGGSEAAPDGKFWKSGDITVSAIPVLYSGATIASANITLPGAAANPTQSGVPLTGGVASATWKGTGTAGPRVAGQTLAAVHPTVSFVDSQGNSLTPAQSNPTSESDLNIDNQAPPAAGAVAPAVGDIVYTTNQQNTAANWVGTAFNFSEDGTLDLQTTAETDNNGVQGVTFVTQWAENGAGANDEWTTFDDVNTIAESSTSTEYDLRARICDKLNNCANSAPNALTTTGFGVDLTAPTATTGTAPKADEVVGIGGGGLSTATVGLAATDPQGANGSIGSGFGGTPVLVTETRLAPSGASGQATTCVIEETVGGSKCDKPAAQTLNFNVVTTDPGEYALAYHVVDQAGNAAEETTLRYYIDGVAPTVTGGIAIPASIAAGSQFSASAVDNMDVAASNAYLRYPTPFIPFAGDVRIAFAGSVSTAGATFDNSLTRSATATVTLPQNQFYRTLAVLNGIVVPGVKPNLLGIRALDAVGNLSTGDEATLPGVNISNPTVPPYSLGVELNGFALAADQASVHNGSTTTTPRAFTLTATVTAVTATQGSPFSQVCFYILTPNGTAGGAGNTVTGTATNELALLGCTSTVATIDDGGIRKFEYTFANVDPDAKYGDGTAPAVLNYFVIGTNANGDALLNVTPAVVGLTP